MRIAIIGTRGFLSTYGGFETFVRRLAPHLAHNGHEVTVYGHTRQSDAHAMDRPPKGITIVNTPGIDSKSAATFTHSLSAIAHAIVSGHDAALLLNITNGPLLPLLKAARMPTLLNVDGLEWERAKWGPLAQRAFRFGARCSAMFADELVVDARAVGDVWQDQFGANSTFIPYGADVVDSIDPSSVVGLGVEPDHYALVVARLTPENNVDLFLDAMQKLDFRYPAVVVGSANYDNPTATRLRELHLKGRVRWLGHISNQVQLTELFANARVYVHGHSVGGTNPALLQALGAGAPTLALGTPYNQEVLGPHTDQVFPHDPTALADRIEQFWGDDQLRTAAAVSGRARVTTNYRWDDVCQAYESSLLRLASRRPQRRPSGLSNVGARRACRRGVALLLRGEDADR